MSVQADRGSPPASLSVTYRRAFRRDVFQILAEGYRRARAARTIGADDDEPVVSSRIVDGAEDFLNGDSSERFSRYLITAERPVRSETRFGKRRRKIDIRIDAVSKRVSFSVEAKRLRTMPSCTNAYVGPDGLELFVDGEYGAQEPEGGMIAYVQREEPEVWFPRVAETIRSDRRQRLRVLQQMRQCTDYAMFPIVGRSRHDRSLEPIDMYHLFVDCSESP